ncbi:MAG: ATP-dependent helicase HrpB [Aquidulcibacter sp.]|uniref:ATP-dependent helicase HrpB n=2 Tax=Aquidulcibacter sp. TaxID=2052990 RepID=UPI0022BC768D|nr:ATP-dependent helicase HrpB [Aquidulcibacter sp.]MCE2889857.1 ATP-dependent helicase HrpB [Hyphomonadaceae bacterium]MCZ8208257.1 ATP-dependent helicase HrpB [Aquidulcibacter sp.]
MLAAIPPDLPIVAVLDRLVEVLQTQNSAVLVAPPGAGKTTSVPLALLDQSWAAGKKILMLAPRRLAARAAAARMADLLGEAVGETVGYQVRLDKKISARTRIEVITEGILTRRMLTDPELSDVAAVIFDEVHERNLEGDLGLALALDIQAGLREDLRLIAMSATVEGGQLAARLGGAELIESAGRLYPIETFYVGRTQEQPIEGQAANIALKALSKGPGDVLVFLPGTAEINRAYEAIHAKAATMSCAVIALHGSLSPAEQDQALRPQAGVQRKIILSTAIAETSLTIEGVQIVVDAGLSRRPAFEPDSGLTRLVTVRASRAACDQRRGRAGRTAPGQCYRLWEEAEMGAFPAYDRPEILEADLAPLLLTLSSFGVSDPASLKWLDPPPAPALWEATKLLIDLEALEARAGQAPRLTPHGKKLVSFGLPPRLAHMIVRAGELGFGATAAHLAALLSERGLGGTSPDLEHRLVSFARDRSPRANKARAQAHGWAKQVGATEAAVAELAGRALALAFPERVAKARDRRGGFILVNGSGGELPAHEGLATAEFLAIGSLQGKAANARINEAARLDKADLEALFANQIETRTQTQFDRAKGTMQGRHQRRLGALILEERPVSLTVDQIEAGLFDAVRSLGLDKLNWSDRAKSFVERLNWLYARDPDQWPQGKPGALEEALQVWLLPALVGVKNLSDVDVAQALENFLTWPERQAMAQAAPTHFVTPLETRHTIDYAAEQGPTIEVRVQELFGLERHPMLAGGQVALVFQLLSPAHRPIAVTSNLPEFWKAGWHDVRKDMKARYPRHVWPEDPATAQPTARAKPRT